MATVLRDLADKDRTYSDRFDRRLLSVAPWLMYVHAGLILVNAAIDGQYPANAYHAAMLLLAALAFSVLNDGILFILFTHVYWMFSFMTYFYASVHGNLASFGLVDPAAAAFVAFCSQFACTVALLVVKLGPKPFSASVRRTRWAEDLIKVQPVILFIGIVGVLAKLAGAVPDVYAGVLTSFIYIWLAIRLVSRRSGSGLDVLMIVVGTLIVISSIRSSLRTDVFAFVLLLAVFFLMAYPRTIFSFRNIVFAFLGFRLLSLFSAVLLYARTFKESGTSLIGVVSEKLFSVEALLYIINPLSTGLALPTTATVRSSISPLFFGSDTGFLPRLTLLPQMDMVTGRIGEIKETNWGEVLNVINAILPSFGQDKDLVLSDRIIWQLGLRDPGTVARPMITAEAEWFYMGGIWSVFLAKLLFVYLLFLLYRYLCTKFCLRSVVIILMSQTLIYIVFTSTAISVLAVTVRSPIILILLLSLVVLVWQLAHPQRRIISSNGSD
ncbi:hypothetical protein ACM43_04875 [Bradyrhizobium sp. CCBAU 45321]|uniref:hypothetical protein n=1 Tax=Bradyrhizobium sp. CCBAU 45321 TaxID=1641878 RepID=UPI002303E3FF|nr:hypothetical protein [Bradyrhizobium sp. CCBAU 45321]MDA9543896.1 hypothetical protein [Bradyrhizobium sp. CCBAU 45321]